jgi:TetR/AcrR family transcriptional regulator, transcriptional repressor for nem operon
LTVEKQSLSVQVSGLTIANTMQAKLKISVQTRLIEAAMKLAYQHGFGSTTLADIAKEAKVPPGNLYYYFKTKEEIAEAIVERRLLELQAAQQELGKLMAPKERLCGLVSMWLKNQDVVIKYGCPVGTFCTELNKDGGKPAEKASKIFADLLAWVEGQFREFCAEGEAPGRAAHLLAVLEGVTVLANSLKSAELIEVESERLVAWIRSL